MNWLRPEVTQSLWRLREVAAAALVAGGGLWLAWRGGYVLVPFGLGVAGIGAALGLQAFRRLKFAQEVHAPGVVEIDEGQIGYLGPNAGGFVGLPELEELRLITLQGRRLWRLKQADGQALLIPVDAEGAERLFDAFSSLPGLDTQVLVQALQTAISERPGQTGASAVADSLVIWRRSARVALT